MSKRQKYLDPSKVRNIDDINLTDPLHLKLILKEWDTLRSLSEQHLKGVDLFMELEERWINAPLETHHRNAIQLYLMEGGYTQKEAGDKLGVGARAIAKSVEEGLDIMTSHKPRRLIHVR